MRDAWHGNCSSQVFEATVSMHSENSCVTGAIIMLETHVGDYLKHEHDWCAIPLHEDAQICASCGQIKESQISDSCDTQDGEIEFVACSR